MTATKKRRHRQHTNPFGIKHDIEKPSWSAMFGREAPLALDIGCGPGMFVVDLAKQHPEWNVIGFEIRPHLVTEANEAIAAAGLTNARVFFANANIHLDNLIDDTSLIFVSVNFPDPWFKRKHHKRRVVQPSWAELLKQKLKPFAEIHIMTDYEPLALHMLHVFERTSGLKNVYQGFATASTTGIVSEREITHTNRGEPIHRLQFTYTEF